jgi:hypothetical protein
LANKLIPAFDSSAAFCLADDLRRRQNEGKSVNEENLRHLLGKYENLVEVRYAKWLAAGRKAEAFPCFADAGVTSTFMRSVLL